MAAKQKRAPRGVTHSGDLAKPLVDPREFPEWQAAIKEEMHRRLDLLFDHYAIKRGQWHALAQELSFDHVPGLQFAKRNGVDQRLIPTRWKPCGRTSADVKGAARPSGMTKRSARWLPLPMIGR